MASASRPTGLIAKKGVELLTFRTPNGYKASIVLEELKAAYDFNYTFQCINLATGCNKDDWFCKLNPHTKIPIIVDHDNDGLVLGEALAVVNYLARTYDPDHKFTFTSSHDIAKCDQWMSFCATEISTNQTSALQFYRLLPKRHAFPTQKYIGQTERAYGVLNNALQDRDYLVGPGKGKYSIADMCNWAFVEFSAFSGLEVRKWPNVERWWKVIGEREGVKKGLQVPFYPEGLTNETLWKTVEENEEARTREEGLREALRKAQEEFGYVYQAPGK